MYKMIFIDLDGTLLNDSKEISEENIKQLNRAYKEKGIISVITTGRHLGYVKDLYNRYNCSFGDFIISSDGAIIKNIKTNDYIKKDILSKKEINKLRKIYIEENLYYFMIYTENEAFGEVSGEKGLNLLGIQKGEYLVESIDDLLDKNPNLIVSLCIFGGEQDDLNRVIKKVEKFNNVNNSIVCDYSYIKNGMTIYSKYFDVMRKGVNKKNAINKLIKELGINHNEIIIIGDSGNDLPMFECDGLKIAMSNADDFIKQKADYITDSNNNNGVAKAIKKFIFREED